jgi:16S rRNA processing protein RimM
MGGGNSLVTVGRILRPHGIRGEVKVVPLTGSPESLTALQSLFIKGVGEEKLQLKIERLRIRQDRVILKLSDFDNRSQAESLRNAELLARKQDLPSLPEGHYYIHELVGLTVKTMQGEKIGTICDVIQTPAQDVYVIDAGEKEIMIPAVKQFVKRINIQKNEMWIDPIEGLIESDEG